MAQVASFEKTLQKSYEWLKALAAEAGIEDSEKAYVVLRAGLHALRDRLAPAEAAQLGAQLPMLLRGVYYDGWTPTGKPELWRDRDAFLMRVAGELVDPALDPELAVRAVWSLLSRKVTPGEIEDVRNSLPAELRELWPDTSPTPR